MKLYEIVIKPASGFGTRLKGDTLFGHVCWQAAYDQTLLEGGLDRWISCYEERPFLICSSAWPKFYTANGEYYAVKRPELPQSVLFCSSGHDKATMIQERKENRKKKWLLLNSALSLNLSDARYATDEGIVEMAEEQLTEDTKTSLRGAKPPNLCITFEQQHNTINRLTMTTGKGAFAPFSEIAFSYFPETELAVFILLDDEATDIERVRTAFERIGRFGFGRDASTGLGRFELAEDNELELPKAESANACYALSPVVPEKGRFAQYYFSPFIRFGKHGDILACSRNPFKNPVVMADEGAVLVPKNREVFQKPYIGRALTSCSKSLDKTVHQGYCIYLPFTLEI